MMLETTNARDITTTARTSLRTSPAADPPRVGDVTSSLRLAVMRLARRLRQESSEGLTPSMLSVLASISRAQPVTLGALASLERVQPPTITATVGRLEDANLVRREIDQKDRRVVRVRLTDDGTMLIRRTRTRKDAYLSQRLRRLSPEDLATLDRAATIVQQLIEDDR
jgi:DNA-binding MarR family transcriptional regulator